MTKTKSWSVPGTVRVGPFVFTIRRHTEPDASDRYGETNAVTKEIRIGSTCRGQQVPETLLHELIHAVVSSYGIKRIEEQQVLALGLGLCQALQDLGVWAKEMEVK